MCIFARGQRKQHPQHFQWWRALIGPSRGLMSSQHLERLDLGALWDPFFVNPIVDVTIISCV